MAAGFDLGTEAREFRDQVQDVLNGTVCNGITIQAVRGAGSETYKIGYQVRSDQYRTHPIPLTISAKRPTGYLGVSYSLGADHENKYLMVKSSVLAYCAGEDTEHPMFHYDYERDKDGYPDSHIQVCAESADWETIKSRCGVTKALGDLHLPLGGRRFRPTLENLIEFVIVEGLAEYRDSWRKVLDEGQGRFDKLQAAAAVRRNPEEAWRVLRELNQPLVTPAVGSRPGRHRRP